MSSQLTLLLTLSTLAPKKFPPGGPDPWWWRLSREAASCAPILIEKGLAGRPKTSQSAQNTLLMFIEIEAGDAVVVRALKARPNPIVGAREA